VLFWPAERHTSIKELQKLKLWIDRKHEAPGWKRASRDREPPEIERIQRNSRKSLQRDNQQLHEHTLALEKFLPPG
jgi:hypothetical protein